MKERRRSSFKQVEMPDVDPSIVPYITLNALEENSSKQAIKDLNKNLSEIQNKREMLFIAKEALLKKQKDLISSFEDDKFPDFPSPKYVWSKKKCHKLYIKYYNCLIEFYEENLKIVDLLITFILRCIENSVPAIIEMGKINAKTNVGQDEKVDKSLVKYTKMSNYVIALESKGLNETCKYGDITRRQVWEKMKDTADEYEKRGSFEGSSNKNRFYPPNEFDEIFMKFIIITKISDKFKQCIKTMPKYGTFEDFKQKHINVSLKSIDPALTSTNESNIVRHSLKGIKIEINNSSSDDDENANNDDKSDSGNDNESNDNNDKNGNDGVAFIDLPNADLESDDDTNQEGVSINNNSNGMQRKQSIIEESQLQSLMKQDIGTDNFRNFILALFRLIKLNNPCTQAMLQLFHCAVIRILFDFYYIANSAILYGRNLKQFYIDVCDGILSESPSQLHINKKFFAPEEENLPMREIIENDSILQKGSSALFIIQFMNNPLDMAIQVNRAFKIVQDSVDMKNSKDTQINKNVSSQMTSDDFIDMLKPIYAINPYVCPSGVCRFIELFCELFHLFDILSYGLTTFTIVLKDIDEKAKGIENSPT